MGCPTNMKCCTPTWWWAGQVSDRDRYLLLSPSLHHYFSSFFSAKIIEIPPKYRQKPYMHPERYDMCGTNINKRVDLRCNSSILLKIPVLIHITIYIAIFFLISSFSSVYKSFVGFLFIYLFIFFTIEYSKKMI